MENITKNLRIKPSDIKISGKITITKGNLKGFESRYRCFYSSADWFSDAEWFVFDSDQYCLRIKKCRLMEIPKRAHKLTKGTTFQFNSELPIGNFLFDEEESTIDEAVIYFEEQVTE